MLSIAVCDDEPYMIEDLSSRLADDMAAHGCPFRLSCFSSGRELLQSCQPFDLLFLDIQMSDPDGMRCAKLLRDRGFDGLLVFITVLKDYVFDAFDVEAFDYLLKPLEASRFGRTMDRARAVWEKKAAKNLSVQRGGSCQVIPLDEIVYCEVLGRKIYIHLADGKVVDYYGRMESLEQEVDGRFFKCHRSYLINLEYVRGFQEGAASLAGGGSVPVSRLRKEELSKALLNHMKERRR